MKHLKQKLQWSHWMSNHKEDPRTMAQGIIEETEGTEVRDRKIELEGSKAIRMEVR